MILKGGAGIGMQNKVDPERPALFLVGAIGGMAPILVRYSEDFANGLAKLNAIDLSIIAGALILGVIGGVVALSFESNSLKQALLLGASLPSLFTVGTVNQPQTKAMLGVSSVHAAENPENEPGRKLRLKLPPEVSAAKISVIFTDAAGKETRAAFNGTDVTVPPTASTFRIDSDLAVSEPIRIPEIPNAIWFTSFSPQKVSLYGLRYALGVHSHAYELVPSPLVRVAS
jgi:hypothetical protein